MSYHLFCAIIGQKNAFPVDIKKTQTVDDLKDKIKAKKDPELASFAADSFTLYKVDIAVAETYHEVMRTISQSATCPQAIRTIPQLQNTVEDMVEDTHKELINPFHQLSTIFLSTPAKDTISIIVELPPGESLSLT